jgi:NAD(P)-dependent dehydrogenase (short-subunit alcohol dehydrogenase family)
LLERYPRIHVLVNNAGVLPPRREETSEGHEVCFATNLLGHFLLTELLLPRLAQSAPGRVINVSSGGMYTQKIHVEDLQFRREAWNGAIAYARTKRGQVILTEEWASRLPSSEVVVNSMHPGWADTMGVQTQMPTFYRWTKPFLRTAEQGADTIVWLAASEEGARATGKFFLDRRERSTHRLKSTRETAQERGELLRELRRLAGL